MTPGSDSPAATSDTIARTAGDHGWLWSPPGFLALLGGYVLIHMALRLGMSGSLEIDDAEQVLLAQGLAPGYTVNQPPLYTWMIWLISQVTGPGLLAATLLKYALLFVTFLFLYVSARRLFNDSRLASLCAWSLLLIPEFAWGAHQGFTHTLLLSAACAATFHVVVKLMDRPRLHDYLLLGLLIGIGMLAKYSYALFAAALALAALFHAPARARLLDRRMPATLAVTALVLLPYGLWLWGQGQGLGNFLGSTLHTDGQDYWHGVALGMGSLATAVVLFLTPLWLFYVVLFPRAVLAGKHSAPRDRDDIEHLLGLFFIFVFGMLLLLIIAFEASYFKNRWMHPVLLLLPLYFCCRIHRTGLSMRSLQRFTGGVLILTLLVVAGRLFQFFGTPYLDDHTRLHIPYDRLGGQLAAATGFHHGTLIAADNVLAANIGLYLPGSRWLSPLNGDYMPPQEHAGNQCLIVWHARDTDSALPARLARYARSRFGLTSEDMEQAHYTDAVLRRSDDQRYMLGYVSVTGHDRC